MRKEAKNGFPNVALEGVDKRRPNLVSKREKTVERERERRGKERRRRRREEEEEKKRSHDPKRYGTTWAFKALNCFPCNCMVISCTQT